ncbi:M13 family metallopeptidase [Ligilactobacillus equi]|uniref:Oligoendopeptidase o n=1 Tax=Ligilactobacillus equi DSM 15833 = JCM 10991 TaxID=1423740 RepID=A0A0R1TGC6_9LACO|nr:M13-type metalloendopeptidase [Ligilactobacillus equi]KRL80231.1 oligoendopeptidase o [Ligilactobacillus equi DSM 15833 = JCM 10991]
MPKFPVNEALEKDDLYLAVNGAWLKTAQIPADKSSTGGFADLADQIEKILMNDFADFDLGKQTTTDPYFAQFMKYYRLANNFDKREADGFKPAQAFLDKVRNLKDWTDYQDKLPDLILSGYTSIIPLSLDPDMKNTQNYALYADVAPLILPDKTYYQANHEQAEALLEVYRQMVTKLLDLAEYDAQAGQDLLKKALDFDRQLAPHQKDSTQRADYTKAYNPYSLTDFAEFSQVLDFKAIIEKLLGSLPKKVIVTEPEYYQHLDELLTPENFANFKAWLEIKSLLAVSPYLTDQARVTAGLYSRALSGSKEAMNPQKAAYYLASNQFDQVVGLYYAHKYFGPEAKADVHHMVEKMISVYKKRLLANDWLSPATKQKAVVKLSTLGINVGYPEKLHPLYTKFVVNENLSLLENDLNFTKIALTEHFQRFGKEVDRTRWGMPAHMVNAYYNPSFNVIVFPAAILQAPFYSLKQSSSANYGGIGAVIAHEISHAFDNNGAQFDEFGNLNNWWTKEDLAHFQELAQAMIKQFDGLETEVGKVNGKLVVSENIADAGGLSCALEAAKGEDGANLKEFFENWARIWGMKSSLERQKLLLSIDVHGPHVLRANMQPKNLDDFYTTFDVHEGDGMWLDPKDRVNIW